MKKIVTILMLIVMTSSHSSVNAQDDLVTQSSLDLRQFNQNLTAKDVKSIISGGKQYQWESLAHPSIIDVVHPNVPNVKVTVILFSGKKFDCWYADDQLIADSAYAQTLNDVLKWRGKAKYMYASSISVPDPASIESIEFNDANNNVVNDATRYSYHKERGVVIIYTKSETPINMFAYFVKYKGSARGQIVLKPEAMWE